MLYVSVGQTTIADKDGNLKQLLEVNLEIIHVAINLVNSAVEANMMSWDAQLWA